MAHKVVVTKLIDGPRHAVIHVYVRSDGASADLTDYVLIDPATDLTPSPGGVPSLTIEHLQYDLSGFNAELEFEYLTDDTGAWVMADGSAGCFDFGSFGGLKDRSNVLDGTGKLMLTTSGLSNAGDKGTVIIKVRKD
jgi:hypothetical protein